MRDETLAEKEDNYWIAYERCKAKDPLHGIRDRSLRFIPYKQMPSPVYLVDEVV